MNMAYLKRRSSLSFSVICATMYLETKGMSPQFDDLMEGFTKLYERATEIDLEYKKMGLPSGMSNIINKDEMEDTLNFLLDENLMKKDGDKYNTTELGRAMMKFGNKVQTDIDMKRIRETSGRLV